MKILIFPSYDVTQYGNRLEDIESVKLDNSRFDKVKNDFESKDGFYIDKFRLSGKIVNIYVSINNDMAIDDVKSLALSLVKSFSDDELKYYDFQVFITGYDVPMIGYKNKNSEGLYWNYEGEI